MGARACARASGARGRGARTSMRGKKKNNRLTRRIRLKGSRFAILPALLGYKVYKLTKVTSLQGWKA